jgi:hypothetical protein
MKKYTYSQLPASGKKLALDNYRCIVERKASNKEAQEYYNMGDGYNPILFNSEGNEVDND